MKLLTITRIYRKRKKLKKHPVSGSSLSKNALLMPEVREEWPDCFEVTGR